VDLIDLNSTGVKGNEIKTSGTFKIFEAIPNVYKLDQE
jgi:hypothetical protein